VTAVLRTARATFRSLQVRNYRLYFFGQIVSTTGTWMQSVAQVWLVLRLTHSGLALGITTGLQFLPILLLGPWGGVVADRFDKRKILIVTQAADAVLALTIGVLTLTGVVQLWMVYALALGLGLVTVVDNPTRQSFVAEMVGPDDIQNGISLNSAVFTFTRILGPAIAGALILTVGLAVCFLLNAVSFLAVIAGLIAMRPAELHRPGRVPRSKGQVREGLRYVWTTPRLRWPLVLMALVYTLSFNFSVLMPLLARFSFGGGAALYAQLLSAMGAGSLVGALAMANRRHPSGRLLAWAGVALGVAMVAAAYAPTPGAAFVLMGVVGLTSMAFMATGNTMMQVASTPSMRGRVMAVYAMVFLGSTPIGGPLMGWLAESIGPRAAFAAGGATAIVGALVALWVLRALGGRGRVPVLLRRLADAEPRAQEADPRVAEEQPLSA
jgi:MFS family permease